jgi:hypothetical protein
MPELVGACDRVLEPRLDADQELVVRLDVLEREVQLADLLECGVVCALRFDALLDRCRELFVLVRELARRVGKLALQARELATKSELGVIHSRRGAEHGRHRAAGGPPRYSARCAGVAACPGVRNEDAVDAKFLARRAIVWLRSRVSGPHTLLDRHGLRSIRPRLGARPSP